MSNSSPTPSEDRIGAELRRKGGDLVSNGTAILRRGEGTIAFYPSDLTPSETISSDGAKIVFLDSKECFDIDPAGHCTAVSPETHFHFKISN